MRTNDDGARERPLRVVSVFDVDDGPAEAVEQRISEEIERRRHGALVATMSVLPGARRPVDPRVSVATLRVVVTWTEETA